MATPSEKLAESLSVLKDLQDKSIVAIRTKHLTRTHRERLLKNGFIKEVMKGWYIPTRPDEPAGESTAWYASFWDFCSDYLNERFDNSWCLSPDQSIGIHTGNQRVPKQLLVRSPKGGNKPTKLLHDTSIFDVRLELPEKQDVEVKNNLRLMTLPAALISCSAAQFVSNPIEMRTALSMISDASEILRKLLSGGHSKVAGRLAGAFRNIGRNAIADQIIATMKSADYAVTEVDPFEEQSTITFSSREISPYVNRIRMNWASMRETVIKHFPPPPEIPSDINAYLQAVDDIYATDAYHSLSIEGYRVSSELIERVRSGDWNSDDDDRDKEHKDALAARGYWQAFQAVKDSLKDVLENKNAGMVAHNDHSNWYRELFAPSVTAGIIEAHDLAGYRNQPVYIRKSMHVPPSYVAVRDMMPELFDLLKKEEHPSVRAVLGHFFFVYTHPYADGNGRMGRFLMNVMLASGGYTWTVVPVEQRASYMAALEEASVQNNIEPFTKFIAKLIEDQ